MGEEFFEWQVKPFPREKLGIDPVQNATHYQHSQQQGRSSGNPKLEAQVEVLLATALRGVCTPVSPLGGGLPPYQALSARAVTPGSAGPE